MVFATTLGRSKKHLPLILCYISQSPFPAKERRCCAVLPQADRATIPKSREFMDHPLIKRLSEDTICNWGRTERYPVDMDAGSDGAPGIKIR